MIISASRRTDIPKFHSEWFMDRVREGFCTVPNPFNPKRVAKVSLRPEDVDALVFWTKDPAPMMPHLAELDRRGLRYCFHFTVNGYPRFLEPGVPPLTKVIETFDQLSGLVPPERVVWRYDPIVLTGLTDVAYHEARFSRIAAALTGRTRRVVISLVDEYRGSKARLDRLSERGVLVKRCTPHEPGMDRLLETMACAARDCGMDIVSCAEEYDLSRFGIAHGKCIDDDYIAGIFGIRVTSRKDPFQRAACGCVQSKDIGVYGTCKHGCLYCYASRDGAGA